MPRLTISIVYICIGTGGYRCQKEFQQNNHSTVHVAKGRALRVLQLAGQYTVRSAELIVRDLHR